MGIILSNDYGFGNNKSIYRHEGKTVKKSFESRYKTEEGVTGTYLIINGQGYTFGDGKLATAYGHNTKENEIHRTLLYKAMYDCYKHTGETDFYLIITAGLDSWKQDRGQSIKDFMFENKSITIETQEEKIKLNIKDIECYPETLMGAMTADLDIANEDELLVFDIGTKNFQLLKIEAGRPLIELSYSTEYGMDRIYTEICDRVKILPNARINNPNAVKTYLKKTANKEEGIIEEVDSKILEYLQATVFEEIDNRLSHLEISRFCKFVLIGGGASYLERFLTAKYLDNETHLVKDVYYANALGLYKRGLSAYKNKLNKADKNKNTKKVKKTEKVGESSGEESR